MVQPTVRRAGQRRSLCHNLAAVFSRWGYSEIDVPLLEPMENVDRVVGLGLLDSCFKVIDHKGRVLCLRPDFTAPLASMAARQLAGEIRPLKLCYFGSVFRRGGHSGEGLEMSQAGLENIGSPEGEADAECIAVALEGLRSVGVVDVHVALGHAGVLEAWLEEAGLKPGALESARKALCSRDLVALRGLLRAANTDVARSFEDLLELRGGPEVLDEAMKGWDETPVGYCLEGLRGIYRHLGALGCRGVFLDLGLLRDLDYYTGSVFDIYVRGLGEPVAGGGRYDDLLGRVGAPEPAVGFACSIDAIAKVTAPSPECRLYSIH